MAQQKRPRPPRAKAQTERQRLLELLEDAPPQDAKELSAAAHISEKDVYNHLVHIDKSVRQNDQRLQIVPAECRACDFSFTKKGHFSKPGRCPECRGERIAPPLYSIT